MYPGAFYGRLEPEADPIVDTGSVSEGADEEERGEDMKKKWLSLALALALCLGLTVSATAAAVPVAEPDVRTSLAYAMNTLDETDAEGYFLSSDYVFVIDRQGVLWQYKSGQYGAKHPETVEFQKTQLAANVVQIEESDLDGLCILRTDGTLSYLHIPEGKLYEVASGVASLTEGQYVTQQGEVWSCYWDDGGKIVLTPEGGKREREPGLKTVLKASGHKCHVNRAQSYYVTTDHVLHYEYYNDIREQKEEKTLEGIRSIWVEAAGPTSAWDASVFFAIALNGDLYARGINSCGYVGNGGVFDYTSVQTWGVFLEDLLDKTTPSVREVYPMTRILSNVERVWTSDRAYALDKDGNYWTWGDPNHPASLIISATRKAQSDRTMEDNGKLYYTSDVDLPTGKPYASPRKMQAGETVSLLRGYRQDQNGTIYITLDEREHALPHTGGVLGGDLNFTIGASSVSRPTVSGFTDVNTGDWFADPVLWAVEKGVTSGTSATTFSPNQNCTVAQILTFLWRANGSPKPTGNNPFPDVTDGDWYADAAAWAYEKGMVSGGAFGGNAPCTRSMAVTYMWKAAGGPSAKTASFTDVPAGADYANAVAWAVEQGVTAGTSDTTFSPAQVCTRGQIVTFLYRGLAQ